uniref:Integrase catalytic domain-containing protein n=1 Tax=Neogobius melanostomus TaxID=47308 RepID=A0A8C6SL91_9GOBI
MERDVINHVRKCFRCIVGKTPEPHGRAPLESIQTSEPMELVCIDFWTAEQTDKKCVDVLVVTDHFSKMAHAFPCKNQSAKQVARRLWSDFFCVYGFPKRIHSDQGANFESSLMKELLALSGVQKSHTTPYHPMGNGITERFNRTLGNMIRALPPQSKARWPQMLQMLTFCYNCTEHETTGFAPFYLMFGRVPRLPVDIVFQHVLEGTPVVDHHEFIAALRRDLAEASRIALQNSRTAQARQTENYNRKAKGAALVVGDQVLLANRGERGKRKVADKWVSTVFEVVSVRPGVNVYSIKDPDTQKVKTVHRNLLLPVSFLSSNVESPCASNCSSLANDGPEIPVETQDSETRTINWLLNTENGSHQSVEASLVDEETVSDPFAESDVDSVALSPCDSASICAESDGALSQLPISVGDHTTPENHSELASANVVTCDAVADAQLLPVRTRAGRLVN